MHHNHQDHHHHHEMVADKQGSVDKCINDGQSGAKAEHSRSECLCAVQKKKTY